MLSGEGRDGDGDGGGGGGDGGAGAGRRSPGRAADAADILRISPGDEKLTLTFRRSIVVEAVTCHRRPSPAPPPPPLLLLFTTAVSTDSYTHHSCNHCSQPPLSTTCYSCHYCSY